MNSERLLPNEHRLDAYFDEFAEEVRAEIDAISSEQDGEIISYDLEFRDYRSLMNLGAIAYNLREHVVQSDDMRVEQAMYRAILFSYQIAASIHGESLGFDAGTYIQDLVNAQEDRYDLLIDDVQEYLSENPHVADLLDSYLDAIEAGRSCHFEAELAGGMVFMLCERSLAERFIVEEAQNCSVAEIIGDEA